VWDSASGRLLATCDTKVVPEAARAKVGGNGGFVAAQGGITDAAFSPDGRVLASCLGTGEVGHVHLWNARTGKQLARLDLTFCPQAVAFSRDGSLLAAAGGLGPFNLRVWDVASFTSSGSRTPFDAKQFPDLWGALAADDLARAFQAERTLSDAPAPILLPLLREHLRPIQEASEEQRRIARWIADLDSDQFKVREQASRELALGGAEAAAALKVAVKGQRTIEFARRAAALLDRLGEAPPLTPEQRRQQRAVGVLEVLGTPEAQAFLDRLARGAPEAWLTQEAQAAQQRLAGTRLPAPGR
jgi:hypothetical protein